MIFADKLPTNCLSMFDQSVGLNGEFTQSVTKTEVVRDWAIVLKKRTKTKRTKKQE